MSAWSCSCVLCCVIVYCEKWTNQHTLYLLHLQTGGWRLNAVVCQRVSLCASVWSLFPHLDLHLCRCFNVDVVTFLQFFALSTPGVMLTHSAFPSKYTVKHSVNETFVQFVSRNKSRAHGCVCLKQNSRSLFLTSTRVSSCEMTKPSPNSNAKTFEHVIWFILDFVVSWNYRKQL